MSLLIGFLTFILVLTSILLILLVLVQLPKKEAGAGLAFGGGASDALFGAGSGNALTKMTKYTSAVFLGLAVILTMLNAQRHQASTRNLQKVLSQSSTAAPMIPNTPATSNRAALTLTNAAPANSGPLTPSPNAPLVAPPATTTPQNTPANGPAAQQTPAPASNNSQPATSPQP